MHDAKNATACVPGRPSSSGAAAGAPAADAELVEEITWQGAALALIIRAALEPRQTTFLTPTDWKQQVGYIVYPRGGEIRRHVHRRLERHLVGTSEVLIVRSGRCLADIYNDGRELVATRELGPGDVLLMVSGGHGFRMLEDTTFVEVKQGPYTGVDEKECF